MPSFFAFWLTGHRPHYQLHDRSYAFFLPALPFPLRLLWGPLSGNFKRGQGQCALPVPMRLNLSTYQFIDWTHIRGLNTGFQMGRIIIILIFTLDVTLVGLPNRVPPSNAALRLQSLHARALLVDDITFAFPNYKSQVRGWSGIQCPDNKCIQ